MDRNSYVYIMSNRPRATLYVGVTSDLIRRVFQHKAGDRHSFTRRYGCYSLVYFETHKDIREAIAREKAIKDWQRNWKINLVEKDNPEWRDLWDQIANG
jgi:putative endonuclease